MNRSDVRPENQLPSPKLAMGKNKSTMNADAAA
jgi:hypothetical protein